MLSGLTMNYKSGCEGAAHAHNIDTRYRSSLVSGLGKLTAAVVVCQPQAAAAPTFTEVIYDYRSYFIL